MLSQDHLPNLPPKARPMPEGVAHNLAGSRAKKPGWYTPVMKAAKLIAWRFALARAGSEDRLRERTDWSAIGVTEKTILDEVRRMLPCFDEAWLEQGRKVCDEAKGSALHGRLWHMYRKRQGKGIPPLAIETVEHPCQSKKLRPYREKAREVYAAGVPLTRKQIEEYFA